MIDNEEYQPATYESDENDEVESCDSDSETEAAEKQTKKKRTRQYAYKQTFEDHEKSGEWLKSKTWASARFYEKYAGRKQ